MDRASELHECARAVIFIYTIATSSCVAAIISSVMERANEGAALLDIRFGRSFVERGRGRGGRGRVAGRGQLVT